MPYFNIELVGHEGHDHRRHTSAQRGSSGAHAAVVNGGCHAWEEPVEWGGFDRVDIGIGQVVRLQPAPAGGEYTALPGALQRFQGDAGQVFSLRLMTLPKPI
jgi:hypothetical protein